MEKRGWKRGSLFIAVLFMAVFLAVMPCEAAAKSKISKKKATLCVGETLQLKLTGGTGKITWSSNKKATASVSKKGLVTAKKKGSCVITAKRAGKKYKCKITVKELPEGYATVNGKKVKVGSTVKITYRLQSKKKIGCISIRYKYDQDALKILNEFSDSRYKTWLCNEYYPDFYDKDRSLCDIAHLVGVDPKDPYDIANLSCSKAKVVETMKIKVLKSGNYKMTAKYYSVTTATSKTIKDFTVTETVK